ncbi:MAG TPA: efflux RND transporter periplasmic adaptor subunit [Chitinophagaceae bacterium]|jgi:membrane fusion protein (multidrug efflux system)|nr:efflux RND transporter periplasmic adaptor subunit [Chitinophagaceae bacterium]
MLKSFIKTSFLFATPVFIIVASCGEKEQKIAPPKPGATARPSSVSVDVFVAQTKPVSDVVEVPGTLIANEATEIHPEISGRIVQLNVSEGRYVTKGTLLAKIFDGDLQAQLKKLEVQLQIAEQNEQRSAQLLKIQGISKQDYDASLLNVNNIKADIEITKVSIIKTEIRAPFNGRVGLKNISPGAFVTPSTVVASIQQTDLLKLDFSVPEKYSSQIKTGQKVQFTTEGSSRIYTAKVMATDASVAQETRSLMIRSIVENKDASLVPGAFAKVSLHFDADPNAVIIPTQAVIPQARGKKVILYENGAAKFVDVTTGVRDSATIQITEGVKKGDTVVITGLLTIKPESQLKINKISDQ